MGTHQAKGLNGQIDFDGETIRISRKGALGAMTFGLSGVKEIPIRSVTAVQYREAGFTNGFIQFSVMGGIERGGGYTQASQDENSVVFNTWQKQPFQELKAAIDARLKAIQSEPRDGQQTSAVGSGADEVQKLAALLEKGVITAEEFQAAKQRALGL